MSILIQMMPLQKNMLIKLFVVFNDHKKLNEFRRNVDLLTYEFENVAIKTLKQINKQIKILCNLN